MEITLSLTTHLPVTLTHSKGGLASHHLAVLSGTMSHLDHGEAAEEPAGESEGGGDGQGEELTLVW